MSHQASLSPSPILFHRGLAPSDNTTPAPHDIAPPPFHRRRVSHPHNPPVPGFSRSSATMSEPQPPRLEHRASQTLTIDLTDDNDDVRDAPADPPRPQRPPQLGRSDAVGVANIIDLTEDNDVEITRVTDRNLPSLRHHLQFLAGFDHPREPPRPFSPPRRPGSPSHPAAQQPHAQHINRVFGERGPFGPGLHFSRIRSGQGALIIGHPNIDFMEHMQLGNVEMPNQAGYNAFADRRPVHEPPKPAKDGFTRSPTETDVVICPSCESELVHNKEEPEEQVLKKGGRAPSRKDREEHPFWVVRGCGHVYCNNCYQNRLPAKNQPSSVKFREKSPTGKGVKGIPLCAVEDCPSDIKNKDKWVGVFL